jgi:hypothetical protein
MIREICKLKMRLAPDYPLYIATIDLQHPGICNPCNATAEKMEASTALTHTPTETGATPTSLKAKPAYALTAATIASLALLAAWLLKHGEHSSSKPS